MIWRIPLGVGFYSRAFAAQLLGVNPVRLNRWVTGYTYWTRVKGGKTKQKKHPIIKTELPSIDHTLALSFIELMELRVVKAFLERGISLQRVRTAAIRAIDLFNSIHPLASRRVFTGGANIFAELTQEADTPDVLQLTGDNYLQIQSGQLLTNFLDEISFNRDTSLAERWWPLSRAFQVVLDPKIAFGAPIVEGTAVRTDVVAGMVKATSRESAAQVYVLSERQVDSAIEFEKALAA